MTLIDYLEKNKNARLLFGKKEIEIVKKQLLGLSLTPSEKTRLSRDIKKKVNAIEEISKYKNEFSLKKSQEINFIINESKEIILEKLKDNVKEIILFGSYAQGIQNKISDIDLAIKVKKIKGSEKAKAKILGEVNKKIDISIYNSLPEKIKVQIRKIGKTIYKDE